MKQPKAFLSSSALGCHHQGDYKAQHGCWGSRHQIHLWKKKRKVRRIEVVLRFLALFKKPSRRTSQQLSLMLCWWELRHTTITSCKAGWVYYHPECHRNCLNNKESRHGWMLGSRNWQPQPYFPSFIHRQWTLPPSPTIPLSFPPLKASHYWNTVNEMI